MPNEPAEPDIHSYESVRMMSDELSYIFGLPSDEAELLDKSNPSLKWQVILSQPGKYDLSLHEIKQIENYILAYEKF